MIRRAFVVVALAALQVPPGLRAQEKPSRVILFIGDGVGASYWTAARFASPELAVNRFRVMGLVDTRASNAWITDSAAGATAFAAGVRTYNGAIGVGPDGKPVETVLEVARDRGWATGLVATSSVTHATPAAFAAHVVSRAMQFDIARDLYASGVDVLLGGGWRWFHKDVRPDTLDFLGRMDEGYALVTNAVELEKLDLDKTRRLVGLFAESHLPEAGKRWPSLPDMTRAALQSLHQDDDGFFLMVEGSQPDWRGHDNAPLDLVVAEVLDFDRAIAVALDYQVRNPETLVLVTADHETGGLALGVARDSTILAEAARSAVSTIGTLNRSRTLIAEAEVEGLESTLEWLRGTVAELRDAAGERADSTHLRSNYTTLGHTPQMVPLFAMGPGADRFGGIIDNYRVGQILLEMVRK